MIDTPTRRTCSFEGCDRPHESNDLCASHRRQERAGRPLTPIKVRESLESRSCVTCGHNFTPRTGDHDKCTDCRRTNTTSNRTMALRAPEGKKWCLACQRYRAIKFFPKGVARCKPCNREYRNDVRARSVYGLLPGEYDRLKRIQGGRCAICQRATGASKALAVDHDHACCDGPSSCGECVRGLLCSTCNNMLGWLRDDVEAFVRAVAYLKNPPYERLKEDRDGRGATGVADSPAGGASVAAVHEQDPLRAPAPDWA